MDQRETVLCSPVRTAIGTFDGSLKAVPATELGATAVRAVLTRSGLKGSDIGTVVMGNVVQAGNKMNPARQSAVNGGIPVDVPAMTVNRVCGSGAQAIVSAAQEVMLGMLDGAIAGGMENMDLAPYLLGGGRWGYRLGDAQIYDSILRDGLNDAFSGEHSGWHTEDLVKSRQITREAQDRWAERSQKRFSAAQEAGKFKDEITSVELHGCKGPKVFDKDEQPAEYDVRESRQAPTSLSQGWNNHGGKCAGAEQWSIRDDRCGTELGRKTRAQADGATGFIWGGRR